MFKHFTAPVLAAGFLLSGTAGHAGPEPETITVIASRIETPLREVGASVSVLTADDIELRGYSNVADLLKTLAGVNITTNGGIGKQTSLRIRGEEAFRTKILVDGVDITNPSAPQGIPNLEHLLTGDIERIEVLRGPQGMMYGADSGGVIKIFTKKSTQPLAGSVSLESGKFSTERGSANIHGSMGLLDYSASVGRYISDGFNAKTSDNSNPDDDGYSNTTRNFRIGLTPDEDFRVQFQWRDIEADNDYDECFRPDNFAATNSCKNSFDQQSYQLSGHWKTGRFDHKLSYSNNSLRSSFFSDRLFSFASKGEITEENYTGEFNWSEQTRFVFGIDNKREQARANGDISRDQLGGFVEWQQSFIERIFLTAGFRHDSNDDFGSFKSYRVTSAFLLPTPEAHFLKLKTSIGNGFRAPSISEILYNTGDELTEETSKGFDAGIEYRYRNLSLEMVYFDQSIRDVIDYDINTFDYIQLPGKSRSKGIEFTGQYDLTSQLALIANFTMNKTETPTGEQRLRRPRKTANIGLSYQTAGERLRILANYRRVADQIDSSNLRIPDFGVLDISANFRINRQLEVYTRIENALNRDYQEALDFNTPGIAIYSGLRLRF